jgi:hypothetical protein
MKIKKIVNFSFSTLLKQQSSLVKIDQILEKKPQNFEEAAQVLNQISSKIADLDEKPTITSILQTLKFIKNKSKTFNYPQRVVVFNYEKEIIMNLNEKLLKEFQEIGLKEYINPDKKPDFHINYLKELSVINRLEFINLMKKIDKDLELHNTNILNKYTVISFDENVKMKKKMIRTYMPYFLFISLLGTTLYWIWAFYYCFEFDVWLFDPRVTDYHVYRFS